MTKKIKLDKANAKELFVAMCKIRNSIRINSVRDEKRKLYPVYSLFMLTEGYIPSANDHISVESSGGYSLRNFRVVDLLHTRTSWEAMGISKGKLPSTVITDQHGNETYPFMMMNGVLIDPESPEFIERIRQARLFPHSAMLPALEQIKLVNHENFEDDNPSYRDKGPFPILDRFQSIQIRMQNLLFQERSALDEEIKTICLTVVQNYQEALNMKEKLELSLAMLELASNNTSKYQDEEISSRIIDSFRAGLRKAEFENIVEKNELAMVLQTFKMYRDQGETIDLEILLSEIMGAFSRVEEVHEPTLQAAMVANIPRIEYQEQRGPPSAGGASRSTQPYKRRFEDDKPATVQDHGILDKILKSICDLKSEVGIIKKYVTPDKTPNQLKQTETQAPKRFGNKGTESNKRPPNFAGVAREMTTFTPKSLVDRPLTTITDDDFEQTAFMTMTVGQQPIANYFRIMTSHHNSNVLGDYCIRYSVQQSHGAGHGYPTIDSVRIPDPIPQMYSPQSSVPIDCVSPHLSLRAAVADTIMTALMKEQQDMEAVSDDKPSSQIPSILSTSPYCPEHVEVLRSPPPKAIRVVPQVQSTSPSFSPSAPQVEPFEPEIEIPARDHVKSLLLFPGTGVADTSDNKPGPYTRSSARAKSRIIPESVHLPDSDEEIHFPVRPVRLVSYGASASPADSTTFQQTSAVLAPTITYVPPPSSFARIEPLRTSSAVHPSGTPIRFKLSTKANRITVPRPYGPKNIDDDVPDLVSSSSDEGDM